MASVAIERVCWERAHLPFISSHVRPSHEGIHTVDHRRKPLQSMGECDTRTRGPAKRVATRLWDQPANPPRVWLGWLGFGNV